MKLQFAAYVSVSVINNNIFIFNERTDSIYCVVGKEEKNICLKLIKNLEYENGSEDLFLTEDMKCERCPGMALMETGNMFGCDSYAKNIAQIRSNNYCKYI